MLEYPLKTFMIYFQVLLERTYFITSYYVPQIHIILSTWENTANLRLSLCWFISHNVWDILTSSFIFFSSSFPSFLSCFVLNENVLLYNFNYSAIILTFNPFKKPKSMSSSPYLLVPWVLPVLLFESSHYRYLNWEKLKIQ